jgi:hypothetical protein
VLRIRRKLFQLENITQKDLEIYSTETKTAATAAPKAKVSD